MRKYRIKFKSWLKKWVNLREVKTDGSFFPQELSDHVMVSKTLPRDVFSPTITHMRISEKFMKIFFEVLAFFQFWVIFTYIFLTKLCTKMKWRMIERNNIQIDRIFQDWQSFNKIWKYFPQLSYFVYNFASLERTYPFEYNYVQSFFTSFLYIT